METEAPRGVEAGLKSPEAKTSSGEVPEAAILVANVLRERKMKDLTCLSQKEQRVLSKDGQEAAVNLYQGLLGSGTREGLREKMRALYEYQNQIQEDPDLKDFLKRALGSIEARIFWQDEKTLGYQLEVKGETSWWYPAIQEFSRQRNLPEALCIGHFRPSLFAQRRKIVEAFKPLGPWGEEKILGAIRMAEAKRMESPELAVPQEGESIPQFLARLYGDKEAFLMLVREDLEDAPERLREVNTEQVEKATAVVEPKTGRSFFERLKKAAYRLIAPVSVALLINGCAGQLPSSSVEALLSHLRVSKAEAAEPAPEEYLERIKKAEALLKTAPPPKDPYLEALADQKLFQEEEEELKTLKKKARETKPVVVEEEQVEERLEDWETIEVSQFPPYLQRALEVDQVFFGPQEGRNICFVSASASAWGDVSPETLPDSFEDFIKKFDYQRIWNLKEGETEQVDGIEITKESFEGISDPQALVDKLEAFREQDKAPVIGMNGYYTDREGKRVDVGHAGAYLGFINQKGKLFLVLTDGSNGVAVRKLVNYTEEIGAWNEAETRLVILPVNEGFFRYFRVAEVYVFSKN